MSNPPMTKHAYDRLKERFGTYFLPDIFTCELPKVKTLGFLLHRPLSQEIFD